jgi:hypothetical protein
MNQTTHEHAKNEKVWQKKRHMPLIIGLSGWSTIATFAMVAGHTFKRQSANTLLNLVAIKHYDLMDMDM